MNVTAIASLIDYNVVYLKFERDIIRKPTNLTQLDMPILVGGLKAREYNYTLNYLDTKTVIVRFNYSTTVRDLNATIDFSRPTRATITDKYNYTLSGSRF